MSNAARKRKNIRTDESLHRQRVAKKAVERLLESRGFEIVGQPRRIKNRHLIDVRDPSGRARVLWFKLGWRPGDHGTSGVQIAMLKSGTSAQRPASLSDAEVLKKVSRKFQRARADGVSDLLLFSLDNNNQVPIACLLIPITHAEAAFQEELRLDRRRARNGASPTFWIKGNDVGTRKLQRTVERFATENLVSAKRQRADRTLADDAIDDFTPDSSVIGNAAPERRFGQVAYFPRNKQVRDQAIARAGGRCEYCNQEGFLTSEGRRYLESHHIQALGEEGPDTEDNVIALCASDHREAHFGRYAETLAIDGIAEPWFTFTFQIESDADSIEASRRSLSALIKERNDLIHHLLACWNPHEIGSCQALSADLDEQRSRIVLEIETYRAYANGLKVLAKEFQAFIESDAGKKQFDLAFLQQSRLVALLASIANEHAREDGWTLLSTAGQHLRQLIPDEFARMKDAHGEGSLQKLVIATDLFDVVTEQTPKGGTCALYRVRAGVDA